MKPTDPPSPPAPPAADPSLSPPPIKVTVHKARSAGLTVSLSPQMQALLNRTAKFIPIPPVLQRHLQGRKAEKKSAHDLKLAQMQGLTGEAAEETESALEKAFADTDARIELDPGGTKPIPSEHPAANGNLTGATAYYNGGFCQWGCESNGVYRPVHRTRQEIPPSTYRFERDDRGYYLKFQPIATDSLITLDDTASQRVVEGIRKFWASKPTYRRYGLTYKRGVLLFGPAGSGKTGTIMLLAQELIQMGGVVVFVSDPTIAGYGLVSLRAIEPERPLILVFEDIDELIKQHGEHMVLALLDGEFQIPNVVSIATTNYPERLGPRIINRPSRFDERIFVNTPNELARARYLRHITREEPAAEEELARWIADSAGFSIAHLREMVIAVRCLGQEYEEVVGRLKSMGRQVKAIEDFPKNGGGGFSERLN